MRGVHGCASVPRALLVLAILLVAGAPGRVFAQDPAPECETGDCRRASDELADPPPASVRREPISCSRFGACSRRCPVLTATRARRCALPSPALAEALGRWDRAIRAYQTPLAAVTGNADVHVALGTVQFERGRPQHAASEWAVASRLAPDRAPTCSCCLAWPSTRPAATPRPRRRSTRAAMLPPRNAVAALRPRSAAVAPIGHARGAARGR